MASHNITIIQTQRVAAKAVLAILESFPCQLLHSLVFSLSQTARYSPRLRRLMQAAEAGMAAFLLHPHTTCTSLWIPVLRHPPSTKATRKGHTVQPQKQPGRLWEDLHRHRLSHHEFAAHCPWRALTVNHLRLCTKLTCGLHKGGQ